MTSNVYAEIAFYAYLLLLAPLYRALADKVSAQTRGALLGAVSLGVFLLCGLPLYLLAFYALYAGGVALYGLILFQAGSKSDRRRAVLLGLGVLTISLILMFLNYNYYFGAIFFKFSLQEYLASLSWVGLSYFTFRAIDVLIYAGSSLTRAYSPVLSLGYLLFFPTFLLGPINRYSAFVHEIEAEQRPLPGLELRDLALRVGCGVLKALWIAPLFLQHSLFALKPEALPLSLGQILLACYASYLYIYIEFSGYSDIAISVARLFNINAPENFNLPFLSGSIKEFWNRWHISFAHWCRDNIFFVLLRLLTVRAPAIPPFFAQILCFFVTFLFMGAWHGDSLNWLLYGVYHALGMCLWFAYNRFMDRRAPDLYDRLLDSRGYKLFCCVLTFHFVALGLVLTRDFAFLGKMLG
jgi:D-alanyl-lipoteichoic acid acyltransferase DltB (MBOAT superfamily)